MRESNLQKQNAFSEWTNSNPLARYSLAAFMRGTSVAHRPTLLSDRRVSCSSAKTQNGSFSFRLSDADKCTCDFPVDLPEIYGPPCESW
jgi:hypothetical protein